jgi:hypothetical protein
MNRRYNYNTSYGSSRKTATSGLPLYIIVSICAAIIAFVMLLNQRADSARLQEDMEIMKSEIDRLSRISDSLAESPAALAKPVAIEAKPYVKHSDAGAKRKAEKDTIKKQKPATAAVPAISDTTKAE